MIDEPGAAAAHRITAAARAALAGGALASEDLLDQLRANGHVAALGITDPTEAEDEALMVLLESEDVWFTADGATAVDVATRLADAWFVHRLDDAELAGGAVALLPDLAPLSIAPGRDATLRLVRDGVDAGVVALVPGDADGHGPAGAHLRGDDGWLADFARGDAVAMRRRGDVLEIAPAAARPGAGGREAELVRVAHDALASASGNRPVWLYAVVLEVLATNDHAFRRAVRPLAELLEDAGLVHHEGRVGPAGTDLVAAVARDDAEHLVAGLFALEPCCQDALADGVDALARVVAGEAVAPTRELAAVLAHGDVAPALVAFADAWRPDDGVTHAARLAEAFADQHGRARAGGALLLGVANEHLGDVATARACYEEAVLADASLDVALEHLASLVALGGDLDTAIRLRARLAERDDREDDDDGFDPDLAFLLALRPPRPTGVGRNDPCPCGSGRKFKACCLNKPAALSPEHHELWLDQKLATFAAAPGRFFRLMVLAITARPDALHRGGPVDALVDSGVPTTWLLYDDGLVHEFAARYRDALPAVEQPMLDARCAATRALVRVDAITGDVVTVRDVATGVSYDVRDEDASAAIPAGVLLTVHLAHSTTGPRFASVPIEVPPERQDELLALLADAPDGRAMATWYGASRRPVSP